MSTEYPKISIRLQELISQANNSFPSTGESIMAAYNQALEERYTPRQAKKMLYDNVVFLNERTIRRHLPLEARNTEKIRTGINTVDNDPLKSTEKDPLQNNGPLKSTEKDPLQNNQGSDQVEVTTGTISNEENTAPNSSFLWP